MLPRKTGLTKKKKINKNEHVQNQTICTLHSTLYAYNILFAIIIYDIVDQGQITKQSLN